MPRSLPQSGARVVSTKLAHVVLETRVPESELIQQGSA
jgi:hypothetical protein